MIEQPDRDKPGWCPHCLRLSYGCEHRPDRFVKEVSPCQPGPGKPVRVKEDEPMKGFHVTIERSSDTKFHVKYWWNTDCRADEIVSEIPVLKIASWVQVACGQI